MYIPIMVYLIHELLPSLVQFEHKMALGDCPLVSNSPRTSDAVDTSGITN